MPITLPGGNLPQPSFPRLPLAAMVPRQPRTPAGTPARIPAGTPARIPAGTPARIPPSLLRAALAQRQRQRPQVPAGAPAWVPTGTPAPANPALYQAALRQALGRMISPQLLRNLGAM